MSQDKKGWQGKVEGWASDHYFLHSTLHASLGNTKHLRKSCSESQLFRLQIRLEIYNNVFRTADLRPWVATIYYTDYWLLLGVSFWSTVSFISLQWFCWKCSCLLSFFLKRSIYSGHCSSYKAEYRIFLALCQSPGHTTEGKIAKVNLWIPIFMTIGSLLSYTLELITRISSRQRVSRDSLELQAHLLATALKFVTCQASWYNKTAYP